MGDKGSILVLDDDPTFRSIVHQLLSSRGFDIAEARSAREATGLLNRETVLAIVDYRLQAGTDGAKWIEQCRESGYSMPIVFVSGTWCDAKVFNRLRNLFQVSLVLKKPIDPHLFIQQVEFLLPGREEHESTYLRQVQSYVEHSRTFTGGMILGDEPKKPIVRPTSKPVDPTNNLELNEEEGPDGLLERTRLLNKKLKIQKAIAESQKKFNSELEECWKALSRHVEDSLNESDGHAGRSSAREIAHRLRGTAGSVGYTRLGELCGRIEDLIAGTDDWAAGGNDAVLMGLLQEGRRAVDECLKIAISDNQKSAQQTLLVVAPQDSPAVPELRQGMLTIGDTIIRFADSFEDLLQINPGGPVKGVVLNKAMGAEKLMDVAESLRRKFADVPLVLLADENDPDIDSADLVFAGISFQISGKLDEELLHEIVRKLTECIHREQPRILIVDDDDVLSGFLAAVLMANNYSVRTLAEPINTMETISEHQPDLLLLDVTMPGLSGYDVCRQVRETISAEDLPIIFTTAKVSAEARIAAFQSGGNDYISKPVFSGEVLSRVAVQLDRSRRNKERLHQDDMGFFYSSSFIKLARQALRRVPDAASSALVGLVIANFDEIAASEGYETALSKTDEIFQQCRIRFRAEALRARFADDRLMVFLPGENLVATRSAVHHLLRTMERDNNASLKVRVSEVTSSEHGLETAIAELKQQKSGAGVS